MKYKGLEVNAGRIIEIKQDGEVIYDAGNAYTNKGDTFYEMKFCGISFFPSPKQPNLKPKDRTKGYECIMFNSSFQEGETQIIQTFTNDPNIDEKLPLVLDITRVYNPLVKSFIEIQKEGKIFIKVIEGQKIKLQSGEQSVFDKCKSIFQKQSNLCSLIDTLTGILTAIDGVAGSEQIGAIASLKTQINQLKASLDSEINIFSTITE